MNEEALEQDGGLSGKEGDAGEGDKVGVRQKRNLALQCIVTINKLDLNPDGSPVGLTGKWFGPAVGCPAPSIRLVIRPLAK